MAALLWAVIGRVTGPSDTWDQRQPRTVSYTTDMLVNGGRHWILPVEAGRQPATKPPLYNWLAAPVVALAGFSSEVAHKFPSLAAICVCWLAMVRLGRWLDPAGGGSLGWVAGMMFVANYAVFKLGYLARPDMLLVMWLLGGWMSATAVLTGSIAQVASTRSRQSEATSGQPPRMNSRRRTKASVGPEGRTERSRKSAGGRYGAVETALMCGGRRRLLLVIFWVCVAGAALTKGPPALILPAYALLAARGLRGSWRAAGVFGWGWGVPLSLGLFGAWVMGVYLIDPDHLLNTLWREEVLGRVTGLGHEGNERGPVEFYRRILHIPFYFLTRFGPWSILSVAAIAYLWRRDPRPAESPGKGPRRWQRLDPTLGQWLHGAALMVVLTLAFFTPSTGKRADYVAPAVAPGALLAAWWLLKGPLRLGRVGPPVAAAITGLTLAGLMVDNRLLEPKPGLGDALSGFIHDAEIHIRKDPRPIALMNAGSSHMASYLGSAGRGSIQEAHELILSGRPLWLISGGQQPPARIVGWLRERGPDANVVRMCRSRRIPENPGWPSHVALYRVDP
ncbi:MAG: hypothetical protein IH888_11160 [Planctomycetes bacterium]|nr:hypothetical protein [Planctomycetota bacterium]